MNDLEYYIKGGFFMGNKLNDTGLRIVWNKVWSLVKSITGDVNVTEKGTLQKQIDDLKTDCFQSVSDGKALVASAITDKGVTTAPDATFSTMAQNVRNISAGVDISNDTVVAEVLLEGYTAHDANQEQIIGTLPDKTVTDEYTATATLDTSNSELQMTIPAMGKYDTNNKLKATYAKIASLIGLTAAKLVKGNTILGITGNSNNMDTSVGTITSADQLLKGIVGCSDGKTYTGTVVDRRGTTVAATAVSQDDTNTYFNAPAGIYDANSKIYTPNSNLINEIGIIATDSTNKTYSIDTKANYVFVGTCALSDVNSKHKKIKIGENYTENFSYDSQSATINYTWNDRKLTITRSSDYGITSVIIVY